MVIALLAFASLVVLFFAWGFLWQAVDVDEFPDDQLPQWFVSTVRKPLLKLAHMRILAESPKEKLAPPTSGHLLIRN